MLNYRERGFRPLGTMDGTDRPPLCAMEHLYDHFYKVLWKLLVRAPRRAGDRDLKPKVFASANGSEKERPGYVTTFAGCRHGDGASTMAYNFACAFASYSSRSVLLVDGNIRNPMLHLQIPARKEVGLTDLVEGKASIDEAVTEITKDKYYFLRSGARSVNPVMLYESPEFLSVVERLRDTYDVTIFDSPPLVENPESVLLASSTDGLILVLQADRTRWEVSLSAVRDLEGARVPVIGAILNKKRFIIPEPLYRLL